MAFFKRKQEHTISENVNVSWALFQTKKMKKLNKNANFKGEN